MRTTFIAAGLTALAGCAASDDRLVDATPHDVAVASAAELDAVQVEIESLPDVRACTRRAPTGSRIVVQTCVDEAEEAMQASIQNQSRIDLEEMRRRQVYQEQARQHALREAIRGPRARP